VLAFAEKIPYKILTKLVQGQLHKINFGTNFRAGIKGGALYKSTRSATHDMKQYWVVICMESKL